MITEDNDMKCTPAPETHVVGMNDVSSIVTRVMKEHCGEGGCPRIDWYRLRNELVSALASEGQ